MEELAKINNQINNLESAEPYFEKDELTGVHQNDLDNLFDNVWIGGKRAATDKDRLQKLGITHILNVTC